MLTCKKCNFANIDGTSYCQRCGFPLKKKFKLDLKYISDGSHGKGVSIAPLAVQDMENRAKANPDLQKTAKKNYVKVIPLPDKNWYCPDCGAYNKAQAVPLYCRECGRDFITE